MSLVFFLMTANAQEILAIFAVHRSFTLPTAA